MPPFRFIDTHCHLDDILARLKIESYMELLTRFFPPEFLACITISCDPNSVEPTLELMENDRVYGAFGIHPHESKDYTPEVAERIAAALNHPKCVAYGEIGLDYHYDHSDRAVQREILKRQIEIGIAAKKTLIVHTREAESDTLDILHECVPRDWPMHVHCFTSSRELAENLLGDFSNLHLGFTGVITFKNAGDIRDVVKIVPTERMLVETDGPYLAPEPYRGQTAHPGHIPRILQKLAEIKELPVEDLANKVLENSLRLYGISIT